MERAVPVLPVDDLARAKRFYVDGLAITLDCPMTGHGRDACVSLEVLRGVFSP